MPAWGPIGRRDLIRGLRNLGFEGPFSGGRHQFMVRDDVVVAIPNPHGKDIGIELLSRVLRQAGVTRSEWENA
ncbi:MAG: type II toxin-antitoxin system HicA family toxin [Deltaproteobacteria bacterium]|nr:type II toxin-antitoxin system HicA family toxin [Deltaproteobacteria bacterium]